MPHETDLSRASWMQRVAPDIYKQWMDATLALAAPERMQNMWDMVAHSRRTSLRPEHGLPPLGQTVTTLGNMLKSLPGVIEVGEQYLQPFAQEITHYTSAGSDSFEKQARPGHSKILTHALDGLTFALGFPVGVANDARLATDSFATVLTSQRERAGQYGHVINTLGGTAFAECVEVAAFTGFGVWGSPSAAVETYAFETGASAQNGGDGWRIRALRGGLVIPEDPHTRPTSILELDPHGEPTALRPEVIAHLHVALREQNRNGLSREAAVSAGGLEVRSHTRVSTGCPVRGMGLMRAAIDFTARELHHATEAYAA